MKPVFVSSQSVFGSQPPSGGCVLKLPQGKGKAGQFPQPPSGGCVLKPFVRPVLTRRQIQPPSGGCVLKRTAPRWSASSTKPAAFGRLCVETANVGTYISAVSQPPSGGCVLKRGQSRLLLAEPPAAFGRLCVETAFTCPTDLPFGQPPSGGCVLKQVVINKRGDVDSSRLRAAVCGGVIVLS